MNITSVTGNASDTAENNVAQTCSSDAAYHEYLENNQAAFTRLIENEKNLFRVNVAHLADQYVTAIPEAARQHYNCQACRSFVKHYGNLAVIATDGSHYSPVWNAELALPEHKTAIERMAELVAKAPLISVFVTEQKHLGNFMDEDHQHLLLKVPERMVSPKSRVKTRTQKIADKTEAFKTVKRAILGEVPKHALTAQKIEPFTIQTLNKAIAYFNAGALPEKDKFLAPLTWLRDLTAQVASTRNPLRKSAFIWKAVAAAPEGFCHPRNAVTATVLEELQAGILSLEQIRHRFQKKIDGDKYQRPTAPPKEATIDQAETLFEQLGLADSTRRRYAKIEEVDSEWLPTDSPAPFAKKSGIFAELRKEASATEEVIAINAPGPITFGRFLEKVLPTAENIEVYLPYAKMPFMGILTAAVEGAEPLLRWDKPERRNPFSAYRYTDDVPPQQFGLQHSCYHKVTAITKMPELWYDNKLEKEAQTARILIIEGARDQNDQGAGIFPEIVRNELHGVRSVIEAYSNRATREGGNEASACGLAALVGMYSPSLKLRVKVGNVTTVYVVDRNEG